MEEDDEEEEAGDLDPLWLPPWVATLSAASKYILVNKSTISACWDKGIKLRRFILISLDDL